MLSTIVSVLTAASTFAPVVNQRLVEPTSGAVKLELGTLSEPLQGELSQAARAWALGQRSELGLEPTSTLSNATSFGTRFGASFHLVQEVQGVEVYGGKVVVTIDRTAAVAQVSSSLARYQRALPEWNTDLDGALKLAAAAIPFPVMRNDGTALPWGGAKQYFFPVGEDLHAGYLVYVPSLDRTKNWYVAVDAVTGQRLFVQNRMHTAALDAQVYPVSPGGLDAGVGVTPTVSAQLVHGDGGSMVADSCETWLPDGGGLETPNDGGMLCGTQLTMWNCCPTAGCVADAGVKRVAGATTYMGVPVQYDVAVCDRLRRASNDPTLHASGNYEYTPVDPPTNPGAVDPADPANSDEFAEVHSFYHVNRVYDWVRGLSAAAAPIFPGNQPAIVPFKMRDERRTPARKVGVWANLMFPNFNEITSNPTCIFNPPCRVNTLLRLDNAAFMPVEQFAQIPIPEFNAGVDTLLIFQGNSADAAYDAMVIQHEFGHGVVYATAELTFDSIALDNRSANNESGALHEGFADYTAAAFNNLAGVGPYFGPRALAAAGVPGVGQESFLRTMENTFTCPTVLWGEVHQDSQHVAASLWKARTLIFRGTDNGATFDAAWYAMLVSLAPNADFASVAAIMADKVHTAFPAITDASAQMTAIFTEKGVIGCSKVIDLTGSTHARPYYGIASASSVLAGTAMIPGPYQMKFSTPTGASKVHVAAVLSTGFQGGNNNVSVLVKAGGPMTFTKQGNNLVNDADRTQVATVTGNSLTASVEVDIPCATSQEVYVTLAAPGGGATLQRLQVSVDPRSACAAPDAGPDTTTVPFVGGSGTVQQPRAKVGCGCSGGFDLMPAAVLGLLALLRRRRA